VGHALGVFAIILFPLIQRLRRAEVREIQNAKDYDNRKNLPNPESLPCPAFTNEVASWSNSHQMKRQLSFGRVDLSEKPEMSQPRPEGTRK
jgi:hypothetical protein